MLLDFDTTVMTGYMNCRHLWGQHPATAIDAWHRWSLRARLLIPDGTESDTFTASRVFAAAYPEAVDIAALIAAPAWRALAAGDVGQQRRFSVAVGLRIGRPDYRPHPDGDAIAHWMKFDSGREPSQPATVFPQTRGYYATAVFATSAGSGARRARSATWFAVHRRGGGLLLHHRHIRPVLIRAWSPPMDGVAAAIWASQTTSQPRGAVLAESPATALTGR